MCTGGHEQKYLWCCVCVYAVEEKEDQRNGLARGLYIPCPDHYKNYCVHGECQFPSILAQPSCRYTHTHVQYYYVCEDKGWVGIGQTENDTDTTYITSILVEFVPFLTMLDHKEVKRNEGREGGIICNQGSQSAEAIAIITYGLHLNHHWPLQLMPQYLRTSFEKSYWKAM